MTPPRGWVKRAALAGLLLLALAACAPKSNVAQKRYFWPPPPGEAKIEFVRFVLADTDVTYGRESALTEAVLGREKPKTFMSRPVALGSYTGERLYVSDPGQGVVHVLDFARHDIRVLLQTKGREAKFTLPNKVVVDEQEHVWVVDSANRTIKHFGPNELLIDGFEVAGSKWPIGLAVDRARGRLYVADAQQHNIAVLDLTGKPLAVFGKRGRGDGELNFPCDVALDQEGNLFVVDVMNARIMVFSPDGGFVRSFGERGTAAGAFSIPKFIAISPAGHVYVTDTAQHKIVVFDRQGSFLINFGGRYVSETGEIVPGGFNMPEGVAIDRNNGIWIADSLNGIVQKYQYLDDKYLKEHPLKAR